MGIFLASFKLSFNIWNISRVAFFQTWWFSIFHIFFYFNQLMLFRIQKSKHSSFSTVYYFSLFFLNNCVLRQEVFYNTSLRLIFLFNLKILILFDQFTIYEFELYFLIRIQMSPGRSMFSNWLLPRSPSTVKEFSSLIKRIWIEIRRIQENLDFRLGPFIMLMCKVKFSVTCTTAYLICQCAFHIL